MYNKQNDPRYAALRRGLNQLNNSQLRAILSFQSQGGEILCDNFNYDVESGLWCPLAIGLGVHKKFSIYTSTRLTNYLAKKIILEEGKKFNPSFSLNPLKGISGDFFRRNRAEDLLITCEEILTNRTE